MNHKGIPLIIGFRSAPGLIRDPLFLMLWLAGLPVAFVMAATEWAQIPAQNGLLVGVSILLWFPLTEELAFRGLVQGVVGDGPCGKARWLGLSWANLAATVAFTLWHLVYQPSLFVLTLIVPSLIFGFFRDRYDSLIPPLILHIAYNGFLLLAVGLIA